MTYETKLVDNFVSMNADENWMTFTLRYICDFKARRTTKDQLFTRIFEKIEAHPDKVRIAGASIEVTHPPQN